MAARRRLRLSPAEREALWALVATGSLKDAGHLLGVSAPAMKHRLTSARERNGGATNVTLAFWLGLDAASRDT